MSVLAKAWAPRTLSKVGAEEQKVIHPQHPMDMHVKHQTVPVSGCTGPKSGEAARAYLLAAEHQPSQSLRAGGKTLPPGANVDVSSFWSFNEFSFYSLCFKAPDVRPKGEKQGE